MEPLSVPLSDSAAVLIPNAFSLLLMKLHACSDRVDDEDKQLGRHHALDVYRVIAMLSEPELELVRRLRREFDAHEVMQNAVKIVEDLFAHITSRAVLRMRAHVLAHPAMQIERAIEVLHELFAEDAQRPAISLQSLRG